MTPLALQVSRFEDASCALVDSRQLEHFASSRIVLSDVNDKYPDSLSTLSQFIKYFLCRMSLDFGYCTSILTRRANPATYFLGRYAKDSSDFASAWGPNSGSEGLEFVVKSEILDEYFETIRLPEYYLVLRELLSNEARTLDFLSSTLSHLILGQGALTDMHVQLVTQSFPSSYGDPFGRKALLALNIAVACFNRLHSLELKSETSFPVDSKVFFVMYTLGVVKLTPELLGLLKKDLMVLPDDPKELAIRVACLKAGHLFADQAGITPFQAYLFLSGQIGLCRHFVRYCPTFRY